MLFNSYPFLFVFLPAVLGGFFVLRRQPLRLAFLVLASYVFYAYEEWWFPALMVASTAIAFAGRLLARGGTERRRRSTLAVGIAGVLALLAYFKYAGFVAGNAASFVTVLTGRGFPSFQDFAEQIALPVGISFFTFEAISYMVDVYRGDVEAESNPLRFAFFISFFPHLIAGPIVRYGILAPQLRRVYQFDRARLESGLLLFSVGLVKKVVIADGIATQTDPLLADPASLTAVGAWSAMIGYAFQIYFDFAGYTDMALGLARMFGIELPWNFDRPYRSRSPREFWRRWHVTLSTWLRDYLYVPLGGNRHGENRRDVNLMVTMGLGGLWHGAALNFVVWGLYHGGLLVANRRLQRFGRVVPGALGVVGTFALVTVGWVFFRLSDVSDVGHTLAAMTFLQGIGSAPAGLLAYLLPVSALVWLVPEEWRWPFDRLPWTRIAAIGIATGIALVLINGTQRFIYFQF